MKLKMGTKEIRNRARKMAWKYAENKMLDYYAIEELEEILVKQTKWTLKRMRDVMPKL
ncbi:MAG: hypothetical protein MJZ12_00160 [Prevotella sp.]|nr:hypothetical protein [Prevotella sp.]